jgi:hypothetical protein
MGLFKKKDGKMPTGRKVATNSQQEQAIRNVFSTFAGDVFMEWLEDYCFMWETTDVPGDPIETAKNEKLRALLLDIKRIVAEDTMNMATNKPEENDDDDGIWTDPDDPSRIRVRS